MFIATSRKFLKFQGVRFINDGFSRNQFAFLKQKLEETSLKPGARAKRNEAKDKWVNRSTDRRAPRPNKFKDERRIESPRFKRFRTRHVNRVQRVEWKSVDSDENEFMNQNLTKIYATSPEGEVSYVDSDGKFKKGTIFEFLKDLDDEEDTLFEILSVQQKDGEEPKIFIKKEGKSKAMKSYFNQIAEEKTRLYGRTRAKKRESNIKFLKISWEISLSDLENQKSREIESTLKKGYKLKIAIDTKNYLNSRRFSWDDLVDEKKVPEDTENEEPLRKRNFREINQYERIKREKMIEYLNQLFDGKANFTIKGELAHAMLIEADPIPKEDSKDEDKILMKQDKKLERQRKQKEREEKKKARLEKEKVLLNDELVIEQ